VLRVKTVEALPRPMSAEIYAALPGELRTRRDRRPVTFDPAAAKRAGTTW
jgi:hypothetical protein